MTEEPLETDEAHEDFKAMAGLCEMWQQRALKAEAEVKQRQSLLTEALPGAMFASCKHQEMEGANPNWHCCDWAEWVDKVAKELDITLPLEDEEPPTEQ